MRDIAGMNGSARKQRQCQRNQHQPGRKRVAGAKPCDQTLGIADRQEAHSHADRQKRQSDLERVVAKYAAQIEGAEEEQPEHSRNRQHLDEVGDDQVARPEDPQWNERVRGSGLTQHKGGQQGDRGATEGESAARPPSRFRRRV